MKEKCKNCVYYNGFDERCLIKSCHYHISKQKEYIVNVCDTKWHVYQFEWASYDGGVYVSLNIEDVNGSKNIHASFCKNFLTKEEVLDMIKSIYGGK